MTTALLCNLYSGHRKITKEEVDRKHLQKRSVATYDL